MTHDSDAGGARSGGNPSVWPCLAYRDARAAIRFLVEAFGFVEQACYGKGEVVDHAQLGRPGGGGGVMLGSVREGNEFNQAQGHGSIYLVTDDPDALLTRAVAAGAEIVRDLKNEDYGSRGFTVRDPEGNLWSVGTYGGE